MGVPVAAQEAGEPQHVAVVGRADDHRPAGAGLEQPDAAQDERAHDALAELGLGHQQGAQPLGRDDEDVERLARMGVDQRRPARELRKLAHERARQMRHHRLGPAGLVVPRDLHRAGEHHAHAEPDLADMGQRFVDPEMAHLAEPAHAGDLGVIEPGKHLIAAGVDDRSCRCGHAVLATGVGLPEAAVHASCALTQRPRCNRRRMSMNRTDDIFLSNLALHAEHRLLMPIPLPRLRGRVGRGKPQARSKRLPPLRLSPASGGEGARADVSSKMAS
jgi:hypothetical protein